MDCYMINRCQPKIIIKLYGYFRLLCQHGGKGTDAVMLFLSALPFRFNSFILLFHFLIAAGVAFVPLQVFSLVLRLNAVLLDTLADQFSYDLHLLCQGSLLAIQFRAIAEGGLYQMDIPQNMLPISHQLSKCP